jgi:hypothetical protein
MTIIGMFRRYCFNWPPILMSLFVGVIAVISAVVPKNVVVTQWLCISAMGGIAIYLFACGVRGAATSPTLEGRKCRQAHNGWGPHEPSSMNIEFTELGTSPCPRFVAVSQSAERTGNLGGVPAISPILEGPTPESIIRRLQLYGGNKTSADGDARPLVTWRVPVVGSKQLPFAYAERDNCRPVELTIGDVLDQVRLQRNVISIGLGILGGIFAAIVGVGVVTAHLKRGGDFSIFSIFLLAIIAAIALWFTHLGLSSHFRVRSSQGDFKIQRLGLFGFRTLATIPQTVEGIWLFINSAHLPRFILISSGNEFSSISV